MESFHLIQPKQKMIIGLCKFRLILELNVLLRFGPLNDFEIQIQLKDKTNTDQKALFLHSSVLEFTFFCLNDFNMQIYIYIYVHTLNPNSSLIRMLIYLQNVNACLQ